MSRQHHSWARAFTRQNMESHANVEQSSDRKNKKNLNEVCRDILYTLTSFILWKQRYKSAGPGVVKFDVRQHRFLASPRPGSPSYPHALMSKPHVYSNLDSATTRESFHTGRSFSPRPCIDYEYFLVLRNYSNLLWCMPNYSPCTRKKNS